MARISPFKDPAPNGIDGTTKLTRATREAIGERLLQIDDAICEEGEHGDEAEKECRASWADTIAELKALEAEPTHGRLSELALAFEELMLWEEEDDAVRRDLRKAERIEAKRDWDQFIAEGGDPNSIMVTRCSWGR